MDKKLEKFYADRAVKLGRSGDPNVFFELIELLKLPSSKIRKFTVSAIGKLSGLIDGKKAVEVISPILNDPKPQTRQYTIKALTLFGADAKAILPNIQDIADNPLEKDYNIRDANIAIQTINEALRIEEKLAEHHCQRCHIIVSSDEYARSQHSFQRSYCDKCFDEVYLKRRNFDTTVEINKTIQAKDGTLVQSTGERLIADWLFRNNIAYRYDERFRIIDGMAVRPDFYLPEFDIYIEYWGMNTADYKIGMLKKQKLYQQQGKKIISLYPKDKNNLDNILRKKLNLFSTK